MNEWLDSIVLSFLHVIVPSPKCASIDIIVLSCPLKKISPLSFLYMVYLLKNLEYLCYKMSYLVWILLIGYKGNSSACSCLLSTSCILTAGSRGLIKLMHQFQVPQPHRMIAIGRTRKMFWTSKNILRNAPTVFLSHLIGQVLTSAYS